MVAKHIRERPPVVSHGGCPRGEGKILLEGTGRGDNGIALHLESIQGEWNARVTGALAQGRRIGVIEGVFMEIQVSITANARYMRREVGGTLSGLWMAMGVS